MAHRRSYNRYRRNVLPPVALKGERVRDIVTGFLQYTERCTRYRGGWVDRSIGPDINPKTGGIDTSNSPGTYSLGGILQPGTSSPRDPAPYVPPEIPSTPPGDEDTPDEPVPGTPTTYYVSPTGDDTADGSQGTPFQTLQHAADVMVDGESCTVMDGTHTARVTIRTDGLTFIAESANHEINVGGAAGPAGYCITVQYADRIAFYGIKTTGSRRGFYINHSDNVALYECQSNANRMGLLAGYSNNLLIDGGVWNDSYGEQGIYVSNHSQAPIIRNILAGNCDRNMSAGIQINADRQFPDELPDHAGPILGAVIENVTMADNCQDGVGASLSILGCHGARITDVTITGSGAGGINFANDDNTTPEGLWYGSKNCVLENVSLTGNRGISVKRGSTGLVMDNITVVVSNSACIDYDNNSFPPMTLGDTYTLTTTHPGFKAFRNSNTGRNYTVEQWRAL